MSLPEIDIADCCSQWTVVINRHAETGPARAIAHCVPITDAAISLKYVLIKGQHIDGRYSSILVQPSFYYLILNAAAWTLIGIACFRYLENWSRDKGTLGAY